MANQDEKPVLLQYVDAETAETLYSDEESAFRDFKNSFKADDAMGILRVSRIRTSKFGGSISPQSLKGGAHCFSVPIDQYEFDELLEVLREKYGGGLYRLIGVQKGVAGTKFNRMIEIAADQSKMEPEKAGAAVSGQGNMGEIIERMDIMMQNAQERTESMFKNFAPQAAVTADPFAMMERITQMFSTMGILGANKQPDILGELEKLSKLKELAGAFSDGNSAGANFYDMAGKVVENFGPAFMAMAANMPRPGQPVTATPTPGQPPALAPALASLDAPGGEIPAAPGPSPVQTHIDQMKPQVAILVSNAKNNADPEAVGDMVVNMTPDERLSDLYEMIAAENCIERLIKLNPEVQNYLPFFEALRVRIKWLLLPEEEATIIPESDAAGETGGADSDAKPDGDQGATSSDT